MKVQKFSLDRFAVKIARVESRSNLLMIAAGHEKDHADTLIVFDPRARRILDIAGPREGFAGSKKTSALSALDFRVTGSGRGNESLRNGRVAGLVASSTTQSFLLCGALKDARNLFRSSCTRGESIEISTNCHRPGSSGRVRCGNAAEN